ncbi:PQQ-dependent dehydrogenase, methanol/ethanol family [Proteobacteria bacterium 005FR1]|nr:PQQ-dependent dehydrogenase, methanol/ethanol family [Proteobacteria bacterium 005FR1]
MIRFSPLLLALAIGSLAGCDQSSSPATPQAKIVSTARYGATVNADRLIFADPREWLSHGRSYDEQRFSPLDQINADSISSLGLAWYADMDTSRGQEATPIVVDGALYVTTAWSNVKAFDAKSGKLLWAWDAKVDRSKGVDACCDVVNRGVAVWNGKVFVGTLDGRLVALDSATGELVWEKMTVDTTKPYTITGAPRVIKGKVIIGNGGAELGVRGYVSAYDAETGEMNWRFYTVPGNPEDGFEQPELEEAAKTWKGKWWEQGGGGTVWDSVAYDPELDLLYIGVGNGSPWNQAIRSPGGGDNLFLASIVALDPDDGSYRWHYQTTPGETWDYTATQHIILANLEIDGEERRVIMQAPKNGFFYVIDAITGKLISAEKFVPANWATHVDLETGRPVEMAEARYEKTGKPFIVYPGPQGGHNWHPMAFNPETGLVYIPAREQSTGYVSDPNFEASIRGWNTGIDFAKGAALIRSSSDAVRPRQSYLKAWDPVAQKERWRVPQPDPGQTSGILTTGGDLVFMGNAGGEFVAYHAQTGERLWSHITQAAVVAAPSSYVIDGEQYVALLVGSRGLPEAGPGAIGATTDKSTNNSRLLVYKLGGPATLPNKVIKLKTASGQSDRPAPPPVTASNETIAHGEQVYGRYCSVCHGPTAVSPDVGTFPDLRHSPRIGSNEAWASVVMKGELAEQGMVSFAPSISDSDADAIRHYVISRANQQD